MVHSLKNVNKSLQSRISDFVLKPYRERLDKINKREDIFQRKSDRELKVFSKTLKSQARAGISLNELLPDAFALVREVCKRVLNMRPYDVQIITAMILQDGKLAEMKTGEGKTLAAVMPAYLNALTGKGVHILTFNDYLAQRDAEWMRPVYEFLGLTVGYIGENRSPEDKRIAYQSDITYATAKEIGFDFLRSFIAYNSKEILQRPFNFAIVDEADALLIDEARNPLVLAGNLSTFKIDLHKIAMLARNLEAESDYETDEFSRNIFLTDTGIKKAEQFLSVFNLHTQQHRQTLAAINQAIHALVLLKKDIDYVVKNGQVKLVDEFTGRIVEDRKWQNGLQMAVEAKEGLDIQSEGTILGSISLMNFMKHYPKMAGMTATAAESYEEFQNTYGLQVVSVPPNLPCQRIDFQDLIFTKKAYKQKALIEKIINIHRTRRPILIGTLTVKESEELARLLLAEGLSFKVLNAKNDEEEAMIIANAGALDTITISTNMAGRGTDIKLGGINGKNKEKVVKLGGLYVIGTNYHESKRIDNQLRGRAGRQGDPGASQFYISFEDPLMEKYKLKELFPKKYRRLHQAEAVEMTIIRNRMELAQEIIDGQMTELRNTLEEYTKLVEQQRKVFQDIRQQVLINNSYILKKEGSSFSSTEVPSHYKDFILHVFDTYWAAYLDYTIGLKDGIHLVRLGGRNPLKVFNEEADKYFVEVMAEMNAKILETLNQKEESSKALQVEKPSSTWTYIINDNPFGNQLGIMLSDNSNIGMQVDFLTAPLLFLAGLVSRIKQWWNKKKSD